MTPESTAHQQEERKGKAQNNISSDVVKWKYALFRTSCWESICWIFSWQTSTKKNIHKLQKLVLFSFPMTFVLERINCVRAWVLLAYSWGPRGTDSWNYHFLAPHNIASQWEKNPPLGNNKSVKKAQRAALLFRGWGGISKNPSKSEPFTFVSQQLFPHSLSVAGLAPSEI